MENMTNPTRQVYCMDASEYLKQHEDIRCIITSLPDADEVGLSIEKWKDWFFNKCTNIFFSLDDYGYVIFYQTDRKYKGTIIDKSYLVNKAAEVWDPEPKLLFNKIVLRQEPNTKNMYRPTFSHLQCFSFKGKLGNNPVLPDVIYNGKMIYDNAMGLNACRFCCEIMKEATDTIVDPFCGRGSILAVANHFGLNAIGVDISEEQCEKARNLKINGFFF